MEYHHDTLIRKLSSPTICMSAKFRSAAVLLCSDSCRLALPSVFWLYPVIRGADRYRVGRV